ncbi:MAG: MBL fold metallo-hydrolase [Verrucomicrobiota bacterium]|nr:MBL fold metallo-hydrolase [Verrucomicrobiota bacterium]
MSQQIPLTPEAIADLPHPDDGTTEIARDLAYRRLAMVNVVFHGTPRAGDRQWVLIDAGVMGLTGRIESAAEERFGATARPAAIILTHGHFDHIGGLEKLAKKWDAPIYAHELELPYLNGSAAYPPPDSSVGGGIMPLLAPLFPRGPIDVSRWLQVLPGDGSVPGMPGWQWLPTPGHTPGHISLWRETDSAIIVGDAFITTNQESAYAIAVQAEEMHGPPTYFTPDWPSARRSVEQLAALGPELVVTGHGRAMRGPQMLAALQTLARDFENVAVPEAGHYVQAPARAADGTAYREP